jgi:serine/threonine-protein kinase RsbW
MGQRDEQPDDSRAFRVSEEQAMYLCNKSERFRGKSVDLALEEHAQHLQVHTPAELHPVIDRLENRMRVLGYPCRDIFAVKLAVEEASVNAFRHGHRRDPAKTIHVRYLVTADEVLIEVEDQGRGFDPDQVPDPLAEENLRRESGRGVFLLRAYMTWVSFNRQGNRVTLARRRSES